MPQFRIQGDEPGWLRSRTITNADSPWTYIGGVDVVFANAAGGAITVALPAAAAYQGKRITVIKTDATANVVTINPNGAELINGALTYGLAAQFSCATFLSNGTAWFVDGGGGTLTAVELFQATQIDDTDSPYAVLPTDETIVADATAASVTVTLPAVAGSDGRRITVVRIGSNNAFVVTVDGNGAETIDAQASINLTRSYASITVVCDGNEWFIENLVDPQQHREQMRAITDADSPYAVADHDEVILASATGGPITINLPAIATQLGRRITVKAMDIAGGIITLDGDAAETIDGVATQPINVLYNTLTVIAGATEWSII